MVAKHLVAAGELLGEDPERAYQHAVYARRKASRIGAVREAAGLAAYSVGKWQEALSELRAARRMNGRNVYLAVMADCERGLGRPERALEIAHGPEAEGLETAEQIELRIVAAGARRDMGDVRAALVELQVPELKERRARPWVARLFYAYADVLLELGRTEEAREYFSRAAAVDQEGETDADERLAALEGVEIVDIGEDVVWSDAEDPDFEDGPGDQAAGMTVPADMSEAPAGDEDSPRGAAPDETDAEVPSDREDESS
ncbi:FUSC family protein [Actinorugispora endophytica]|uniref:FUSC family protein n=1 Tax=Actinorugispora endophytica TaxID=1605990 RepID=UPI001FB65714|nr:FUSC family protein [Actinorugispora endophytica]